MCVIYDSVDFDFFADDTLDEFDLVDKDFVFFVEVSQHVSFSLGVELEPNGVEFFEDVSLIIELANLLVFVPKDEVGTWNGSVKPELLYDCSVVVCDLVKAWHCDYEIDSVLHVVFSDVLDFFLFKHCFQNAFVVFGPFADWQLGDLDLSVAQNLVDSVTIEGLEILPWLRFDETLESLVPWNHSLRLKTVHHALQIFYDVLRLELRNPR